MALPAPKLDDRTFQDIVHEARRLINRYCPEWTDHNLSDPGITLIELFAWMMEMLLYRLNRVPERNLITFLDLIGVRLLPPAAAKVDLTFTLTAPRSEPIVIPAGTEVATVRTGTEEAIVFSTDRDLRIVPPTLIYFLSSPDGTTFQDHSDTLVRQMPLIPVFDGPVGPHAGGPVQLFDGRHRHRPDPASSGVGVLGCPGGKLGEGGGRAGYHWRLEPARGSRAAPAVCL
jgi:hypothetical protein